MKRRFADLPGWEFEVREMSAGWHAATGRDADGREVAADGVDPEALIERCRTDARQIESSKLPRPRR